MTSTPAVRTLAGGIRVAAAELADGRELLLYDDEHAGADRSPAAVRDLCPLEPHHAASQLRLDPLTREWVTVAGRCRGRAFLPSAEDNPLAPSRPGHLTDIPAADHGVAVFENRFPSFAPTVGDLTDIDETTPPTGPVPVGRDAGGRHLAVSSLRRAADKLRHLAGSESGMGAFISDVVPEAVAPRLRVPGWARRPAAGVGAPT